MGRSPLPSRSRDRKREYDDERERSRKSRKRSRSRSRERDRDHHSRSRHRYDDDREKSSSHRSRERESRSTRDESRNSREKKPEKTIKMMDIQVKEEPIPWNEFPPPQNTDVKTEEEPVEKEKPSLKPSGKLLEDTNMVNGVVVKYVEPPEAKAPKVLWQLHPFRNQEGKDPEPLPVMHVHRRSCYLIGRDRKVVQFPMDHPSCSKQHAALQFRSLQYTKPNGERSRRTKPYLIDLESANGTFINDDRIEPTRYYELKHGDEIKFGFSSRSFVILNATAATAQMEGDSSVKEEPDDDDEEESSKKKKKEERSPQNDKFE